MKLPRLLALAVSFLALAIVILMATSSLRRWRLERNIDAAILPVGAKIRYVNGGPLGVDGYRIDCESFNVSERYSQELNFRNLPKPAAGLPPVFVIRCDAATRDVLSKDSKIKISIQGAGTSMSETWTFHEMRYMSEGRDPSYGAYWENSQMPSVLATSRDLQIQIQYEPNDSTKDATGTLAFEILSGGAK